MAVGVAGGAEDRRAAAELDAGERVAGPGRAKRIDGDADVAVGPFLKPIGIDSPDASWRWVWLSVVRAPIAPQATVSAMYCGVIGSRYSQPIGRPISRTSSSNRRAVRNPALTSPESSRWGSFIRPFHPVVVRGFSK